MADRRRLAELGMVPPLAAEVAAQIGAATGAPVNSPTFTGTPSAPTAAVGTNTTQLATTAFVNAATRAKTQTVALTNLTGAFGTTGDAIVDVTATPTQALINNNFRALEDKVNAIMAALKA